MSAEGVKISRKTGRHAPWNCLKSGVFEMLLVTFCGEAFLFLHLYFGYESETSNQNTYVNKKIRFHQNSKTTQQSDL